MAERRNGFNYLGTANRTRLSPLPQRSASWLLNHIGAAPLVHMSVSSPIFRIDHVSSRKSRGIFAIAFIAIGHIQNNLVARSVQINLPLAFFKLASNEIIIDSFDAAIVSLSPVLIARILFPHLEGRASSFQLAHYLSSQLISALAQHARFDKIVIVQGIRFVAGHWLFMSLVSVAHKFVRETEVDVPHIDGSVGIIGVVPGNVDLAPFSIELGSRPYMVVGYRFDPPGVYAHGIEQPNICGMVALAIPPASG